MVNVVASSYFLNVVTVPLFRSPNSRTTASHRTSHDKAVSHPADRSVRSQKWESRIPKERYYYLYSSTSNGCPMEAFFK